MADLEDDEGQVVDEKLWDEKEDEEKDKDKGKEKMEEGDAVDGGKDTELQHQMVRKNTQ